MSRQNCETSGFVAAPAPTANYGLDVHIDTGLLGLSQGTLLSAVQDFFVTPLWMAVVWVMHALVVMLEWCFTIDLLDSAAAGGVGAGLRHMQAAVTDPWLAIVFALAAVAAAYNGLVRRRVAETLGEAVLMVVMMLGGLWVIADPSGTVGAAGRWANQASTGTLAAAAQGDPARGSGALAQSMGLVFAAVVEAPWCYLEFGNVEWCRDPARREGRLRAAGLRIASEELSGGGCEGEALVSCASGSGSALRALHSSAQLLREAQSNGAIFLALPANGPARNSINDEGSLLHTICQSSDATGCRGPAAAQAEFRTSGGTWARVGGLLLIVVGVLGMVFLLSFIALRLLAAALFSLLYLLLAPGVVLAPALGESGRALFRAWGMRLLGAVIAKLLFAFLLGVVLAILALLGNLQALGWWTQWLLISAFTWGAYTRRHQALAVAGTTLGREHVRRRSAARRVSDALESRKTLMAGRWARSRLAREGAGTEERNAGARADATQRRPRDLAAEQATRTLALERDEARARADDAPRLRRELSARAEQLERVQAERQRALAGGDSRRATLLEQRARRIGGEIAGEQERLGAAQRLAGEGAREHEESPAAAAERVRERTRFLDAQAALPPASRRSARSPGDTSAGERRDYAALAPLAGLGRESYERLDPRRRRMVRLEIDRELALRREVQETARPPAAQPSRSPGAGYPQRRDGGRPAGGPHAEEPEVAPSLVMRDVREVEARRKRQLGWDND